MQFAGVPPVCGNLDNINFHFYVPSIDTYELDNYSFTDSNCDCPLNAENYACQNYQFMFRILTWPAVNNAVNSIASFAALAYEPLWYTDKVQALRNMFRNAYHNLDKICPKKDCMMHHVMLGKDTGLPFLNSYGLSLIQFHNTSNASHGYSSDGKYRLETNVNCMGSMYYDDTWKGAMSATPLPLIAAYATCTFTVAAAVQNTIGNANNIATAIASIILSCFLGISVLVYNTHGMTCYSKDGCNQDTEINQNKIKSTSRKLREADEKIEKLSKAVVELARMTDFGDLRSVLELENKINEIKDNTAIRGNDQTNFSKVVPAPPAIFGTAHT